MNRLSSGALKSGSGTVKPPSPGFLPEFFSSHADCPASGPEFAAAGESVAEA